MRLHDKQKILMSTTLDSRKKTLRNQSFMMVSDASSLFPPLQIDNLPLMMILQANTAKLLEADLDAFSLPRLLDSRVICPH